MNRLIEILVIPILSGCLALIIVLGSISMLGCSSNIEETKPNMQTPVGDFNVIIVEGCEYIVCYQYAAKPCLIHKGNCKNPIHIYNEKYDNKKEMEGYINE